MPPKKSKRNEGRQSSEAQIEVVAIDEHFRRVGDANDPADVAKKLELAYKQSPHSLRNSLACLILRVCGLAAGIPKLDFNNVNASIAEILELVDEKKLAIASEANLLISHKEKHHSKYVEKLRQFLSKLFSDQLDFIKHHQTNSMLANFKDWTTTLSVSRYRVIRHSSLMFIKLLIQAEANQFTILQNKRESKKAMEFAKDAEKYILALRPRLKDIDTHIRDCAHSILTNIILTMETDIVDEKLIEEIYLGEIKDSNVKIVEAALENINHIAQNSKKIKKLLLGFYKSNYEEFQKISSFPNRCGIFCLKFMVELHRFDPEANILNPPHISRVFEYYSLEGFNSGLQAAIDAFYASIYPSNQELLKNRTLVVIQIMNLINNFATVNIKQTIITQFCENMRVSFEDVFSVEDLFNILLSESYNHNGQEIELKERDLIGLILIIETFILHVRKNIERYENIDSEKFQKDKQKWKEIGEAYNTNLLTNIKAIIHEKMRGGLTNYYLRLMSKLVLPVSSAYETYLDFMFERIVAVFERQNNPDIFKEIVQIFFKLKTHSIDILSKNIGSAAKSKKQRLIALLKKISILNQYYVEEFVSFSTVEEIISAFRSLQSEDLKMELIMGLFVVHQWLINYFIESDSQENSHKFEEYKNVQIQIFRFFIEVLEARERTSNKLAALNCLLKIMQIICNDKFESIPDIYYRLEDKQVGVIYNLLNNEIGLPVADRDQNDDTETRDFTRLMNSISMEESQREKIMHQIFKLFECSYKVAVHPHSLRLIVGALLAEDEKQELDLSTTRQNMSFSFDKNPYPSIYAKDKLASNYLEKLVERQVHPDNRSSFVFWQIIQQVYKELKGQIKTKELFTTKVIDIYLKKKLGKEEYKTSLNKALLFVVAEVDRCFETNSFESLALVHLIMKRMIKKITKDATRRIFMFVKDKPEVPENKEAYKNLLSFLDKASKESHVESREEDEDKDKEDGEDKEEEINEREVMVPVEHNRSTRSMSKRMAMRAEE